MFSRGIIVVAITRRGVETALRIQRALTAQELACKVYAPAKYAAESVVTLDQKLDVFIKEAYAKTDALVGVMATGIIIRAVAPHLQGKLVDPAVIAVDAAGKFVISLLSGHYGGANELTRLIAEGISATPVVTTASDVLGKQSVDELARVLHLSIVNPESLVGVNAALVNGGRLALVLVGDVKVPADPAVDYTLEKAYDVEEALEILNSYDAGAIVTREPPPADTLRKPITLLKPKRIVVGVGARKEVTEAQVLEAIDAGLERAGVPLERVDAFATVDIKKEAQNMISAAEKLGFTFEFLSVEELRSLIHEDLSPESKMVQEKIGVGGVSERAALLKAGKNTHLILKKQKLNGVTVAVAEGE